ncbi:NADP oxidoreductase [bacterium]|nr:MAG: NADP oxidoreductase [bacterium]
MKIGIIGAGRIGGTLAKLFTTAGHQVAVSNSREPESLRSLVAEAGKNVQAMTVQDAAAFGEIVILAVPWRKPEALPPPEMVAGKIVIDAMNPYGTGGTLIDLGPGTSSEETAKRLPGCRLVKAFNTIYYKHLQERGTSKKEERITIYVAGDDEEAKSVVKQLIEEIGFAPFDTGSLRNGGRKQQPGSPIYNNPMTLERAKEIFNSTA